MFFDVFLIADAARVFAGQYARDTVWRRQFDLFNLLALLDIGDGDVGIDQSQDIQIEVEVGLDFDQVLATHLGAGDVAHEDDHAVQFVQSELFEKSYSRGRR